jgi:peroxiredoxin
MRSILISLLVLIITAAAYGQTSLRAGATAPTFAAPSIDGTNYNLESMRGTVVVLTFWSTKCEICRSEIPKLNSFMAKYDESKVVFLALSLDNEAKLTAYLRSNPFKFHILPNSFGILLQYADRDREGNIDMGFPSYFLVDKSGKLDYRSNGWDRTDELEARVARLLAVN